jgi:hypothetical protein
MNHRSERQSRGGSTAFSRHCSNRWVLVNVPSFSTCDAAGRKNTSVAMSCARASPVSCSGLSRQNVAVSTSCRSRTTSHSRLRSALRTSGAFAEPTTGFWPTQRKPLHAPSTMRVSIA